MTKFIALGRTADGRLFPLAVDNQGRLIIESSFTGSEYLLLDGTRAMTGDLDLNGLSIVNLDSLEATGDLVIDCGNDKTIRLTEAVYDDFIPSVSVLATGSASPDPVNATILGVVGSYYGFDGGATEERLTVKIEMYHGYKVGSDIEIHVHAMPSTNDAGNVIWYFDYFYAPVNAAPIAGSTLSKTVAIAANTQYTDYTTSIDIIPGNPGGVNLNIGDFIIGTLRRTPTGSDTYPGDMLLKQVAAHCEMDTIGSRQRYIK